MDAISYPSVAQEPSEQVLPQIVPCGATLMFRTPVSISSNVLPYTWRRSTVTDVKVQHESDCKLSGVFAQDRPHGDIMTHDLPKRVE